jgi:hypothetical protein
MLTQMPRTLCSGAAPALPWPVRFVLTAVGFLLIGVACSGPSSPGGPAATPSASAPTPAAPSPAPSPAPSAPSAASCRYGTGSLDTSCAVRTEQLEANVNAAIDRLADRHPEIFDTSVLRGAGEWRVLRPSEYLSGVVEELRQRRLCAETDEVSTVAVRGSGDFSETYDILHTTNHVRRGSRAYLHTCSPPSFPVVPGEAIAYVRVAFYSITCEEGITPPRNGEGVLPIGCRGFITATPKQRNNEDVPRHIVGGDISWRLEQAGDVVAINDDAHNEFNKMAVGRNPGRYSLCATSHGVEGCQHGEIVADPRR